METKDLQHVFLEGISLADKKPEEGVTHLRLLLAADS
jgi:hypothetical protein